MSRRVLFLQGESRLLNPTLDQEMIDAAYEDDAEAAASEWGGFFRSDISSFLTDELIDRAIVRHCRSRPRQIGFTYVGFADSSGGVHDDMCLGIAHQDPSGKAVLDKLVVINAPFKPEDAVIRFAEALSAYGLSTVTGDKYGAAWVSSAFAKHIISYLPASQDKSSIYCECLPLFTGDLVELLDVPILETQLRALERRPRPNGRGDLVDHPPRCHDDAANVACGSLWMASKLEYCGRDLNEFAELPPRRNSNYDPWEREFGRNR